ncbi:MAG: hypothetical protein V4473_01215 [Patescibacteria group bacterium]
MFTFFAFAVLGLVNLQKDDGGGSHKKRNYWILILKIVGSCIASWLLMQFIIASHHSTVLERVGAFICIAQRIFAQGQGEV